MNLRRQLVSSSQSLSLPIESSAILKARQIEHELGRSHEHFILINDQQDRLARLQQASVTEAKGPQSKAMNEHKTANLAKRSSSNM